MITQRISFPIVNSQLSAFNSCFRVTWKLCIYYNTTLSSLYSYNTILSSLYSYNTTLGSLYSYNTTLASLYSYNTTLASLYSYNTTLGSYSHQTINIIVLKKKYFPRRHCKFQEHYFINSKNRKDK